MKKNNNLIYILIILGCLSYLIINITILNQSILYATKLWLYKVFPFLFTMIIINELLINNNIIYYLTMLFKKNGIKIYIILMCILSGSPTNAYIIKNLYNNQIIDIKSANKLLTFSYFSNPFFLVNILSFLFDSNIAIMIIIIHYIPNIVMLLFTNIKSNSMIKISKSSFNNILNKAINTSLLVLGTLSFYILLSSIITNIFNINGVNSIIIKGLIELTEGLNRLSTLFINNNYKIILASLFINFGGLSIHSQIKSIISDTSINYKFFLKGRIYQVVVSEALTIIGILIKSGAKLLLSTHSITM